MARSATEVTFRPVTPQYLKNEIYEGYPLMANSSTLLVRYAHYNRSLRSLYVFYFISFPRRSDGCAS